MPQDISFFLPFVPRVNAEADRARAHHLAWVSAHDLVCGPDALRRYRAWRLTDLASYAYPDAAGEELDLVTDAVCLGFPLDDQFDGELGRQPERAARLSAGLSAIPYQAPGARPRLDTPLARAYADLWRRTARGMSSAWRRRAAANLTRFFHAYVEEATNRHRGTELTEAAYVALRRHAVGTAPCFDLIERAGRFELPARAHRSPELRTLVRCAGDVVFLCNDAHSVEREEAQGDPHNLVLIRQRDRGCGRREAIDQVGALVRARVERFQALAGRLPETAARLRLDAAGREHLERYADGLRSWMIGNQLWGVESPRYAHHTAAGVATAGRAGGLAASLPGFGGPR
jgi:hypothetical protein